MLPPTIPGKLIYTFKYWANNSIQVGMRYSGELYRQVAVFSLQQQQQAYSLGMNLIEYDKEVVVSRSEAEYAVWVSLRSQAQPQLEASSLAKEKTTESKPRFIPALTSVNNHPAIGKRYKLGATNHPQASTYQCQECQVIEVWERCGGEPLLSVQFADGVQIRGLFLCELEDLAGQQMNRSNFALENQKRSSAMQDTASGAGKLWLSPLQ